MTPRQAGKKAKKPRLRPDRSAVILTVLAVTMMVAAILPTLGDGRLMY
jgi:hypothetical protein